MTAMMANPKKRPYQPTLGGGMSIQEYNTRKKYADMGFSERMTDFLYGAEKMKAQAAAEAAAEEAARERQGEEDSWRNFLTSKNLPLNWSKEDYENDLRRKERENKVMERHARIATNHRRAINELPNTSNRTSIVRDISGYPVNPNRVTSLRPGAGINPGQSTYGFSSMQPSNRAGEVYTIDQWGNKRYL
jgi:hypothetical protein